MQFFDCHCDTVLKTLDEGQDFLGGSGAHLDLPRLSAAGVCLQVFAVFTSAGTRPEQGDLVAHAEQALAIIHDWAASSGGRLRETLTARDIRSAFRPEDERPDLAAGARPVYGLLALEGADPLAGRAEELRRFFAAGVRQVIPAWGDNAFSGTSTGSQGPLTAEGRRLIELCEELGVMVDVSHLSDAAFWQVSEMTRRPFVASHSDCRALCPHPRNLTDEMLRALADRGGVAGLNLAPYFLEPGFMAAWEAIYNPYKAQLAALADPADRRRLILKAERDSRLASLARPGIDWAVRHVLHMIGVGGEDCAGLGGDLDGVSELPEGITGVESYPMLAQALQSAGLSARQTEKVCWRNMVRVYADVLPE